MDTKAALRSNLLLGKTIAALADTAALMEQIDEVIEDHGGWPFDAPAED